MKTKLAASLLLLWLACACALAAAEVTGPSLIPISVSVTGKVQRPGIYTVTTLNRVSDVVDLASKLPSQPVALPAGLPAAQMPTVSQYQVPESIDSTAAQIFSNRNVILTRQGNRVSLDLLKYLRLGDLEQNPFLKDGDVIFVSPALQTVSLQGSFQLPGEYEFRTGDTLGSLLELALGLKPEAALANATLHRYQPGAAEFSKTALDLKGYPKAAETVLETALQPGDRISLPADAEYRKAYKVKVVGKVRLPGQYYVDDKTTLHDLLSLCGGPTREADLNSAFLYNSLVSGTPDPDFERLSKYGYSQMTWLEYSYLRTKTRQLKGKYSVSVSDCWDSQGNQVNHVLRDGDELYVPEQLNGVWVAGQVRNPGLVTWQEGLKWKDYLNAAGGFANNRKAQGTRIIRVHSGNWVKPTDKVAIHPGDIIFVPDKEERYTWDYVKEALTILTQVLTVVVALRTF